MQQNNVYKLNTSGNYSLCNSTYFLLNYCGKVKVRAATIDGAMGITKDEEGVIPSLNDGDYVDSGWRLAYEDAESVSELYNNNQQDFVEWE